MKNLKQINISKLPQYDFASVTPKYIWRLISASTNLLVSWQEVDAADIWGKRDYYSYVMKHIKTRLKYALLRATLIAIGVSIVQTNRGELEVDEISFNLIPQMKDCWCKWAYFHYVNWIIMLIKQVKLSLLRREEGSGVKKTSLTYNKVQPVMEFLLFTESQNLRLWQK